MKSGDRLLQIGEVDVRDLTTEEVATILRQSGAHVILIVTRSVDSMPDISDTRAAVIPIDQLDDYLLSINQVTDFSRLSSEADLNVSHQSLPVSNYSSSSLTLNVSRTRLSVVSDQAFPVAAAHTWNSLPQHVTSILSVSVFRGCLKVLLFEHFFP